MTTRQTPVLVDTSHHQDYRIDFAAAKKAGIKGQYHKATEGTGFRDPDYATRRAAAKKAGLAFGAYHFARPSNGDADDEARHFLSVAKPRPGDLLPALDLETTEGLSIGSLRGWAKEWSRIVSAACGGHDPVVYSPWDLQVPGLRWRPRYNDANTPPALPWDVWQFSNGVLGVPDRVAGFPGATDLNTLRKGLPFSALVYPKPKVPRPSVTFDLMHVSMQFSDSPAQMESDAGRIFARAKKRGVRWVTGTESGPGSGPLRSLLTKAAKANGYRFWMHPAQDSWIAVDEDLIAGGWSTHYQKVIDGKAGQFSDKGVLAVAFNTRRAGRITVMAGHYLLKHDPRNAVLAKAIGEYAVKAGRGSALVFYGGDQNMVDRTEDSFYGQPLTSLADELRTWPNTGHGPIDVIASYDGDGRVQGTYFRALDDTEFPLHTDHWAIEGGYRVRLLAA